MSAHDPLCPWVGVAGRSAGFGVCRDCDLIWEARADEREKVLRELAVSRVLRKEERREAVTRSKWVEAVPIEILREHRIPDAAVDAIAAAVEPIIRADADHWYATTLSRALDVHNACQERDAARAEVAALRESIAQAIEARIDDNPHYEPWREAMEYAAAIARGEQP